MRIIPNKDENKDWYGSYPICTVKGREMAEVADWLFNNGGEGYAFAVVFNLINGEYPVPENPKDYTAGVLYLDELFDLAVLYIGTDDAQKRLDKMKGLKS